MTSSSHHGKCSKCGIWHREGACPPIGQKPRVYNKYAGAPSGAVYIGRGSPWGNPFRISFAQTREQVIERFRCEVLPTLDVSPLIGKNLMCFCAPKPCHGDVLLEAAEKLRTSQVTSNQRGTD